MRIIEEGEKGRWIGIHPQPLIHVLINATTTTKYAILDVIVLNADTYVSTVRVRVRKDFAEKEMTGVVRLNSGQGF